MVYRRRAARKGRARRGKGKAKRVSKSTKRLVRKNNMAKVSQLIEMTADNAGQLYSVDNISLAAFDRATQVARGFQYFRITKVKFMFKPRYDTWGNQIATGSVPYLYYLLDKGYNANAIILNSFNAMRDTGAIPRRFDDKTLTVSWRPCVSISVGDIQGNTPTSTPFLMVKSSPWMATNRNSAQSGQPWQPNSVDHRGIVYGVEQDVLQAGGAPYQYDVSVEAYFEFKDPLPIVNAPTVPFVVKDLEDPATIKP